MYQRAGDMFYKGVAAGLTTSLIPLALAGSSDNTASACQQYEFEDNFTNGLSDNWIQMAGAEHADSLVQAEEGGIQLVLRQAVAQSTNIMSKLQFRYILLSGHACWRCRRLTCTL